MLPAQSPTVVGRDMLAGENEVAGGNNVVGRGTEVT